MILNKYHDEIEADFQQYYRLDLLDFYRGGLSPAKTLRLIIALPATSRFARKINGPTAEWQSSEYLLAGILDQLSAANWQRSGGRGSKPKPTPRPGAKHTSTYGKTTRSQAEIKRYLKDLREGKVKARPTNGD